VKRAGRQRATPRRGAASLVGDAARLQDGGLADQLALKDRALDVAAEGVTIADARLPDRPLIYVNEGFERVTGYSAGGGARPELPVPAGPRHRPGRGGRDPRRGRRERECIVEILNYRRDGTPFWNRLSITPVRDELGEVTHYIGIQSDVTARREAEDGLRRAKEALEHDLRLAARVQQALLPPAERASVACASRARSIPARDLAGDAVGVVAFPRRPVGLYLLDVSGHGVGAALLSFTLNHTLSPSVEGSLLDRGRRHGPTVVPPSRVAERLNRQFPMDRTRQYFTFAYGVFDGSQGRFRYVLAGHPAPVLLPRPDRPRRCTAAGCRSA
jgi:phosphoserine phosphatase RsbU/P